jgi:hypothetical protein
MTDNFFEEELGSGGRSWKESDESAGGAGEVGGTSMRRSKLSKELPEKGSSSADIRKIYVE